MRAPTVAADTPTMPTTSHTSHARTGILVRPGFRVVPVHRLDLRCPPIRPGAGLRVVGAASRPGLQGRLGKTVGRHVTGLARILTQRWGILEAAVATGLKQVSPRDARIPLQQNSHANHQQKHTEDPAELVWGKIRQSLAPRGAITTVAGIITTTPSQYTLPTTPIRAWSTGSGLKP